MTKCLLLSMNEWRTRHEPAVPTVETVHLQVGAFTCVEPDQLCSSTYAPSAEQGYRSPCCEHPMEEIVSGRELRIRSVDYTLTSTPLAVANAS
jgi:hydrogenase nickel incorporation protein HypA/HybF